MTELGFAFQISLAAASNRDHMSEKPRVTRERESGKGVAHIPQNDKVLDMPAGLLVQIRGEVPWEYFQDPKSRRWIGINRLLKLTVEEETRPQLFETMNVVATDYFRELLRSGELPEFLRQQGFGTEQPLPSRDQAEAVDFDIPLNTRRVSPEFSLAA